MTNIKIALIGVGNCASALVQGLKYYSKNDSQKCIGLRNFSLGNFTPETIQVVAAFDVDKRKVGLDLAEAIYSKPNNAPKIMQIPKTGVIVQKAPLMDGLGEITKTIVEISDLPDVNVAKELKASGAEIVVNLIPSGAAKASEYFAQQALEANCGFLNATPSLIASSPVWTKKFQEANLPLVGDDLVDQVGSTALHKTLLKLLSMNGIHICETYQLDVGGGTESIDTLDRSREVKRDIKTKSVASALPYPTDLVAGSTDYVDFLENKRDSYFWIKGTYFLNAPMQIDLKFSTVDAPNAGSVLIDVIRAVKLALNKKHKGVIAPICNYGFKHPPKMVSLESAELDFQKFINENT